MRELRRAVRSLLRRPTFSLTVVVTLGLALGLATGLFSVVNALVLRPLPGVHGSGLVNLYVDRGAEDDGFSGFSYPTLLDLRERTRSLAGIEGFVGDSFVLGEPEGRPAVVGAVTGGLFVTGGFFELLGTRTLLGRLLDASDDVRGGAPALVISEPLWQRRFGGRPEVLGQTVRVNGRPFTLVGVTESGFRGHFVGFPLDVFVPLASAPELASGVGLDDRGDRSLELLARLRRPELLAAAQAELSRIVSDLAREHPDSHRGLGIACRPYTGLDADLRRPVVGFVAILSAVGLLVLLVAVVNVAGLVLARGLQRRRELGVRAALGASRRDLARPLLAETLALFACGGLLAIGLLRPTAAALTAFLPRSPLPLHLELGPDWRVLLFAGAATLASAVAAGMGPAARAARVDLMDVLRSGGRGLVGGPDGGRRWLLAVQSGLCLVLLFGAGLFLRELHHGRSFDPGFRIAEVGIVSADLALSGHGKASSPAFFGAWLERVRAQPGVTAASLVRQAPLGLARPTTRVLVDGVEPPLPDGFRAGVSAVGPGYFEALGIALLAGRDFEPSDTAAGEPVVIVSHATARRLFPGGGALGRHLRREGTSARVVGIARDVVTHRSARPDALFVYLPFAQVEGARGSLVVRGAATPPFEAARRVARELDADVAILETVTLAERAGAALFPQRLAAAVTGLFGSLGLLLGSVGLYGLVGFFVERRRHELAVRAALGARPAELRRLALRHGLAPIALGLAGGCLAALAFGRLIEGFLPQSGGASLPTLGVAGLVLATVSTLAALLPARRAAAASPLEVLRSE